MQVCALPRGIRLAKPGLRRIRKRRESPARRSRLTGSGWPSPTSMVATCARWTLVKLIPSHCLPGSFHSRWAAVSLDGSQIVYAEHSEAAWLTPEGSTALWIMQADGEKPQKILESEGSHFKNSFGPPAWSPDGKRIAFVRSKYDVSGWGTTSQIETLETASGKTEFVLQSPGLLGGLT